ncbi:MAG TPA: hypothetical protein VN597_15755, partial [Streptosporangiaceae bacterium]|nr:hypothetical protein [Streptosporangiaceae bacterium]
QVFDNGFKVEWELFLRAAVEGRAFRWDLAEGARGVQLAGLAQQSSAEGRRVDVPPPPTPPDGPAAAGGRW